MKYKTFASINVLIIGSGKVALDFATNLTFTDYTIFIADKNTGNHSFNRFENVQITSIEEAVPIADIIIMATEPEDIREIAYLLGDVRRKVVIDATTHTTDNIPRASYKHFNTVNVIKAITGSQHVIKSFLACEYENVLHPGSKEEKKDMLIAGGSKKAKALIKILANDMGCNKCYDLGGNNSIPLLNAITTAWQDLAARQNILEHIASIQSRA